MKKNKFLKFDKKNDALPVSFNFIDYWKFEDDKERIDNYNDPYFDGMTQAKYQTKGYMPLGAIKPISKIVDFDLIDKK